ncbi:MULTISPECIES: DUF177 domain-containing protein [unclassified Roseivivax]|uniref:DUF177 domain-containing protein n=1 Tax=Roseivivax sp. GX 12232 TaxID=2900547 RepID=UPI001E57C5BA|nr:DUF177 domain-containing protein [Roseivivax sp. GX 12232]MCE0504647.1 DUF177 domain-containing protein [Roseivivax sp. GX 12232]
MAETDASPGPFRVAKLDNSAPTPFALTSGPEARAEIARELGFEAIRKLTFSGELKPLGKHGWRLEGLLGATIVQTCVVTLAPVTTRIDQKVSRTYTPERQLETPEPGSEVEMPEDDSIEPLGESIAPEAAMIEALSLAAPDYPRAEDAPPVAAEARPEGAEPIREEETKPFAGLEALKQKLGGTEGE